MLAQQAKKLGVSAVDVRCFVRHGWNSPIRAITPL
jgi:hypothetical protein